MTNQLLPPVTLTTLAIVASGLAVLNWVIHRLRGFGDGIPIVNRRYALEPTFFSRMRWAMNSTKILEEAHEKYGDRVFRLIRGDTDVLIMPVQYIPEMNKVPVSVINPRRGHTQTLTGHLTGLDVSNGTDRHVRLINSRLTPDIPNLWQPLCERVANKIQTVFPQDPEAWVPLDPVETAASCVGEAVNLFLFGSPACDNPEIAELTFRVSRGVFEMAFIGRLLPPFLQKPLIWLSPQKWKLNAVWRDVERLLYPEFEKRREKLDDLNSRDLLTSMLQEKGLPDHADEFHMMSRLIGVVQTASTYSTSTVIASTLANLATRPQDLDLIREEISNKHKEVGGKWDQAALDNLDKLDSVLKEAARVVPASVLSYARQTLQPHTFSDGLSIRKGQALAVSTWPRIMDPAVFPDPEKFIALREYERDLDQHRASPYRMFDTQEMRWGTGRWACPGRYLASAISKIILVKVIDEYDLQIVGGEMPKRRFLHEFAFLDPSLRLAVRRRKDNSGIQY